METPVMETSSGRYKDAMIIEVPHEQLSLLRYSVTTTTNLDEPMSCDVTELRYYSVTTVTMIPRPIADARVTHRRDVFPELEANRASLKSPSARRFLKQPARLTELYFSNVIHDLREARR